MSDKDLQHLLKSAPAKALRVLHAAIEIATDGMNRNAAFYFVLNNPDVEEELLDIQEIIEELLPELKTATSWTEEEGAYRKTRLEHEFEVHPPDQLIHVAGRGDILCTRYDPKIRAGDLITVLGKQYRIRAIEAHRGIRPVERGDDVGLVLGQPLKA